MINLIFSEKNDFSVNRVMDWLYFSDKSYEKFIGSSENEDFFQFNYKTFSFIFGGKGDINDSSIFDEESSIDFSSVWFRRPQQYANHFLRGDYNYEGVYPKEKLNKTVYSRFRIFYDYLSYKLGEKQKLGSFRTFELNKPIVLQRAQKLGLTIPKTLITNSKKELIDFFESCDRKIITKSLHEVMRDHKYEIEKDNWVFIYQMTQLLDNLNDSPNVFAPSLFQEYIEKEYEIRTIYINGTFYSAAIFSQLNEQTKVDMRNRDANAPARYMPYELDESVESKLRNLMENLDLTFGAIDLIKSTDGDYYFLEINPVGQYGDVSIRCNYYLHKIIAEFLSKTTIHD
ncbi:grasp-with-spasm system ATP-grasp peptide maturase [Aquimarina sp. 433]